MSNCSPMCDKCRTGALCRRDEAILAGRSIEIGARTGQTRPYWAESQEYLSRRGRWSMPATDILKWAYPQFGSIGTYYQKLMCESVHRYEVRKYYLGGPFPRARSEVEAEVGMKAGFNSGLCGLSYYNYPLLKLILHV
jgi:hypothetical protein